MRLKYFFFWLVVLFIFGCSSSQKATDGQQVHLVTQKVESQDYIIEANNATPMRGKQIFLNSGYNLHIKQDSAYAYLPYYGVAQTAPYGGGEGGIKFAEKMQNYQLTPNKKGNGWEARFNVRTSDYTYDFFLTIFDNGSSTISVNSYQRDPISFYGNIKEN